MRRVRGLVPALLCLAVPAPAQTVGGLWFGEHLQADGRVVQHVSDRKPDGRLVILFRTFRDCRQERMQVEAGTWQERDGTYTALITSIDGLPPRGGTIREDYRIEASDGTTLRYSLADGRVFTNRRLAPGEPVPPPPGCGGTPNS